MSDEDRLLMGMTLKQWQEQAPQTLAYLTAFCRADDAYRAALAKQSKAETADD